MNTTKDDSHGAVAGQVDCRVRPALADALDAWWDAAYAEGREGRTHDTEGGAAQKALQDIWVAHSAQLAAAVAAERERLAAEFTKRAEALNTTGDGCAPHIQAQYEAMAGELLDWACSLKA